MGYHKVLGPLLFNIYINDLFELNTEGKIISFADDTAFFYMSASWLGLKNTVERDLERILSWFRRYRFTMYIEKTKYMNFSIYANHLPDFTSIDVMQGEDIVVITNVKSVRYLGVVFDQHLRWDSHIDNLIKKLRGILYLFRILKDFLNIKQLKVIYYALVESHLRYGILAWGGAAGCYLKRLEVIQKRFLKLIFNLKTTHPTEELFQLTRTCDLAQLFVISMLLFNRGQYSDHLMEPKASRYQTRIVNPVKTEKCSLAIGQRCFTYRWARIVNAMPRDINSIVVRSLYTKKAKKWTLDNRGLIHELLGRTW